MLREALHNENDGVKVGGLLVKAVRFVDNQRLATYNEKINSVALE